MAADTIWTVRAILVLILLLDHGNREVDLADLVVELVHAVHGAHPGHIRQVLVVHILVVHLLPHEPLVAVCLSWRILRSRQLLDVLIRLLEMRLKLLFLPLQILFLLKLFQVFLAELGQVIFGDVEGRSLGRQALFGVLIEVVLLKLLVDHVAHTLFVTDVVIFIFALRINGYRLRFDRSLCFPQFLLVNLLELLPDCKLFVFLVQFERLALAQVLLLKYRHSVHVDGNLSAGNFLLFFLLIFFLLGVCSVGEQVFGVIRSLAVSLNLAVRL